MSHSHSCTSARKRVHGGAAPSLPAPLSSTCHPFRKLLHTLFSDDTQSQKMNLGCTVGHCGRIIRRTSCHINQLNHFHDTCCEQTHRSSRCRRHRNLCDILVLTTILITHTSAEHLGRSSCLGAGLSQLIASLPVRFRDTLNRVLTLHPISSISEFFSPTRQTSYVDILQQNH